MLSNENSNKYDNYYATKEHNNDYTTNNDNDYLTNKYNNNYLTNKYNDHANISMPKCSSSTNQPPKSNLKNLQLVPIDKIVRCLFKVNRINRPQLCGYLMGSTDASMGNFISYLISQHEITENLTNDNFSNSSPNKQILMRCSRE
ncbi:6322_t:CDS:2 [Cetraspora pellucida]|uniref:6322_t:CDS:1 n=1 Tax=Cetraspora pellucida TaxID=1433469 RepID=A0A9N9H6M7_9GLOM|nr:6322_t:CDS:2 [Cetraspora pellucida]